MRLIVEPSDGIAPVLAAIARAKKSIEIAIFRFDRKDVELALRAAAAKGVRVTALIAFTNRGGEKSLRKLESRFLEAGMIVARTADDLSRYHCKYLIIDRRVLYVLSFNYTRLDVDRSRGFGVVTSRAACLAEAVRLFKADCTRTRFSPKGDLLVVSPINSRRVLGLFLKKAKKQLLIYDPRISDPEILRILHERAKAGVEIKVIGQVSKDVAFETQKLQRMRLHTRTIVRDRSQAFVGSQSLRTAELDARREVGILVRDGKSVKTLIETFESDWTPTKAKAASISASAAIAKAEESVTTSASEVATAVRVFKQSLKPLASTVKKVVRQAVVKAGEDVLHDKDMKSKMKKVVKQAVKEAVKEAVHDAQVAAK